MFFAVISWAIFQSIGTGDKGGELLLGLIEKNDTKG